VEGHNRRKRGGQDADLIPIESRNEERGNFQLIGKERVG